MGKKLTNWQLWEQYVHEIELPEGVITQARVPAELAGAVAAAMEMMEAPPTKRIHHEDGTITLRATTFWTT